MSRKGFLGYLSGESDLTPLLAAANAWRPDVMETLIDKGADVNKSNRTRGPLFLAAIKALNCCQNYNPIFDNVFKY